MDGSHPDAGLYICSCKCVARLQRRRLYRRGRAEGSRETTRKKHESRATYMRMRECRLSVKTNDYGVDFFFKSKLFHLIERGYDTAVIRLSAGQCEFLGIIPASDSGPFNFTYVISKVVTWFMHMISSVFSRPSAPFWASRSSLRCRRSTTLLMFNFCSSTSFPHLLTSFPRCRISWRSLLLAFCVFCNRLR